MRARIWLTTAAVAASMFAGGFQHAQALTSCSSDPRCRDLAKELETTAPDIIPWDQFWRIDSTVGHADDGISVEPERVVTPIIKLLNNYVTVPSKDTVPVVVPVQPPVSCSAKCSGLPRL